MLQYNLKYFLRFLIIINVLLTSSLLFPQDESFKPTFVAGFINKGSASDSSINILMTRSLISILSKIPKSLVISYRETEKIAQETGLWKMKALDKMIASRSAQSLDTKQMITGDYYFNKSMNKITIHVIVYNVVNGDLKFERTYEGNGGIELLDTIDKMTKDVSGLLIGKTIETGSLSLKLTNAINTSSYFVFINGKYSGDLSTNQNYEDQFISDEPYDLSLIRTDINREVFRKNLVLKPHQKEDIVYSPVGSCLINNLYKEGILSLNGTNNTPIAKGQKVFLSNLNANMNAELSLYSETKLIQKKTVLIKEGETEMAVFLRDQPELKAYEKSEPLFNLIFPGISQYQADDVGMGTLFLSSGVAAAGFSIFSIIGYNLSNDRYLHAVSQDDKLKYSRNNGTWLAFIITGCTIYAGIDVLSILHAVTQKNLVSDNDTGLKQLTADIASDHFELKWQYHF